MAMYFFYIHEQSSETNDRTATVCTKGGRGVNVFTKISREMKKLSSSHLLFWALFNN